ncbi:MAG TPA: OmpA family protein [Verrucomicrobiae bacterium]|nr:OmpA family protein [Verrucomicrobiae bacterium]
MRKRFLAQIILTAVVAAFGLTGCKNKTGGSSSTTQPGADKGVNPLVGDGGVTSSDGSRPVGFTGEPVKGQFGIVYFDYDSARIRPSEDSKLQAVAAYLKSNPGKLVVEGYCDERGTAEFNRALGERRALAAREELVKQGADGSRITTISYGSDRPADMGHDEAAWSKNRRCEFGIVNQ